MKWISVEERLPERTCYCLIYTNNWKKFGISRTVSCEKACFDEFKSIFLLPSRIFFLRSWLKVNEVTHWMPLPEIPHESSLIYMPSKPMKYFHHNKTRIIRRWQPIFEDIDE